MAGFETGSISGSIRYERSQLHSWYGLDATIGANCGTWAEAEAQHRAMVRYVARPSAVWNFIRSQLRDALAQAKEDLARLWRDQRGIEPDELDILTDRVRERMNADRL